MFYQIYFEIPPYNKDFGFWKEKNIGARLILEGILFYIGGIRGLEMEKGEKSRERIGQPTKIYDGNKKIFDSLVSKVPEKILDGIKECEDARDL